MTAAPSSIARQKADELLGYAPDPVGFVRHILHGSPKLYQERWLQAIATDDRVGIQSCRGPGKTTTLAWAAWWFLATRALSVVVVTGAQYERQVRDRFFGELVKWNSHADEILRELFTIESDHVRARHADLKRLWFAQGSAAEVGALSEGMHAPFLLALVDEGKAVPRATFHSIIGSLTGAAGTQKIVVASTPNEAPAGFFADLMAGHVPNWTTFRLGAREAIAQGAPISEAWLQTMRDAVGEGSPAWRALVEGEPSAGAADQLLDNDAITTAIRAHPHYRGDRRGVPVACYEPYASDAVRLERQRWSKGEEPDTVVGIDPAAGGKDRTILFVRVGAVGMGCFDLSAKTDDATVAAILKFCAAWPARPEALGPVSRIVFERSPIGKGVFEALQKKLGMRGVIAFDPSGTPRDRYLRESCRNNRAAAWANVRSLFDAGVVAIPDDEQLVEDLQAQAVVFRDAGLATMKSKDDLRDQLGRSPDRGDALMLAFSGFVCGKGEERREVISTRFAV